jgi:PAS domain S-box-containing protein
VAARLLVPGLALAVLLLAVFFAQRDATTTLSANVRAQARAEQEVSRAYQSETLLLDLETGVRGFLLTHDRVFLEPWQSARSAFPASSSVLVSLEAHSGSVAFGLAREIRNGGEAYINDFAVPEILAVEADPASATSLAAALDGKRRVDALRPLFTELIRLSQRPAAPAEQRAQAAAGRASAYELAGLAAALVLIMVSAVYLRHGVLGPIRRVGKVADARAAGDLSVRAAPSSTLELSRLASSFNTMADALQDSHDRLQAQTVELRRSELFLESVLEHVPALLWVKDARKLRFVRLNRAAEQILGRPRAEVIGNNAHELFAADEAARITAQDRATLAGGVPLEIPEDPLHTPNHGLRYMHTTKVPVMDEHGKPQYLLGISTDMTERKRAERVVGKAREEAERANRAKSEFLSRMSHELRTPLNSILGFGQLLEMDGLSDPQLEPVHYILESGRHLLGLINEVLDISRIEAGRLTIHPEPVAVRALLGEVVAMLAPIAAGRKVALEAVPMAAEYCVLADPQRLKQVLLNLCSNAIKYNREGGNVTIVCEPAESRLRIAVRDTGHGIAAERLSKAFEPFERLGAELGDVEGTGLGLTLARQLMEGMGGTLTVQSEPGVGSTFTAELELAAPDGGLAAFENPVETNDHVEPVAGSAAELLYVEDNAANVKLIERILERRPGITVKAAGQGRLGVELARHHQPDVIVLDLHLPDITGEQVLHELRGDPLTGQIPVIILTADAGPEQETRLHDLGADAYLTKPVEVSSFLAALDALLAGRAMVSA